MANTGPMKFSEKMSGGMGSDTMQGAMTGKMDGKMAGEKSGEKVESGSPKYPSEPRADKHDKEEK